MYKCFFHAISTCVPKVRNYGDFRQCVIPVIITCTLQGTPCDTGIPHTFYGENICSVVKSEESLRLASIVLRSCILFLNFLSFSHLTPSSIHKQPNCRAGGTRESRGKYVWTNYYLFYHASRTCNNFWRHFFYYPASKKTCMLWNWFSLFLSHVL